MYDLYLVYRNGETKIHGPRCRLQDALRRAFMLYQTGKYRDVLICDAKSGESVHRASFAGAGEDA